MRPLEAYLASGHGIAQLRLVVDEGHQPHVGLDEEGLLQDQHAIGLSRKGALLLRTFDSLDQQRFEAFQLAQGGRLLISTSHRVFDECGVGHVGGPGVPPVYEGGAALLVPLNSNPQAFSPVGQKRQTRLHPAGRDLPQQPAR